MSVSPAVIELAADGHALGVSPAGAGLTHWRWQTAAGPVDLLRPLAEGADPGADPLALGCFPLLPYSNRIAHGRFRFEGRAVRLPRNFGDHPHSIHGHGWQRLWQVVDQAATRVELRYAHPADAWPFAYEGSLRVGLDADGLDLALCLRNTGEVAMPAGLGLHPYFPRAGAARLQARADGVWLTDETMLPTRHRSLPPQWDLPAGCAVRDMVPCDNVFTGWDGRARIDWPDAGLALELTASPLLRHLVVYAPAGEDFFCVEPVSHMTDAVNRAGEAGTGLRTLPPGETLTADVRLTPVRP